MECERRGWGTAMPPFFSARVTLSTLTCREFGFLLNLGSAQYKFLDTLVIIRQTPRWQPFLEPA